MTHPFGYSNTAGVGITPAAIWGKSGQRPGLWAVLPRDGAPIFFAVVDDHGNLVRVAA